MVWSVVIAVGIAQIAVTYLPMLQQALGTQSIPLTDGGGVIIGAGVAFFALIEIEKQIRLGLNGRRSQ